MTLETSVFHSSVLQNASAPILCSTSVHLCDTWLFSLD